MLNFRPTESKLRFPPTEKEETRFGSRNRMAVRHFNLLRWVHPAVGQLVGHLTGVNLPSIRTLAGTTTYIRSTLKMEFLIG
jgi:hypothetical protein